MHGLNEITDFIRAGLRGQNLKLSPEEVIGNFEKFFYKKKFDRMLNNKGFKLVGFTVRAEAIDGEDDVVIGYSKKHTGPFFPFPHDHCTIVLCGEDSCIEIEYPCDVDWPFPIDIFF